MPNIKLPADRTRDQFRVHCYQIIGTDIVVFTAHERAEAGSLLGIQHTCIQTFDDTWYGRICSRPLPADINAIPVGNERFDKCAANRKTSKSGAPRSNARKQDQLASTSERKQA